MVRTVAKRDFIKTVFEAFFEMNRYMYDRSNPAKIKTETIT